MTDCEHYQNGCLLGLHGGKPLHGNCRACVSAGENHEEYAARLFAAFERSRLPAAAEMATNLARSASRFARSGFALADAETLASREAICQGCPQWDAAGMRGTGRCKKCGCSTWAKLRVAAEKCPLGRW